MFFVSYIDISIFEFYFNKNSFDLKEFKILLKKDEKDKYYFEIILLFSDINPTKNIHFV